MSGGVSAPGGGRGAVPVLLALALTACQGTGSEREAAPSALADAGRTGEILAPDGIPIAYRVAGRGAPALVLIHGWMCDGSYWDGQLEGLAGDRLVVVLDLPGHGGSGQGRRDFSMAAFGADVAAVADALDLQDLILAGHSMGGNVMLEAAALLPGRVRGLIAVDTFHDVEEVISPEDVEAVLAPLRQDFASGTSAFVRRYLLHPDIDPDLGGWIATDMASGPPRVGLSALAHGLAHRQSVALDRLDLPVVCVNGDQYPTRVEAGLRHAPSFQVILMPGVGHFPMLERPAEFLGRLQEAVERLAGG